MTLNFSKTLLAKNLKLMDMIEWIVLYAVTYFLSENFLQFAKSSVRPLSNPNPNLHEDTTLRVGILLLVARYVEIVPGCLVLVGAAVRAAVRAPV